MRINKYYKEQIKPIEMTDDAYAREVGGLEAGGPGTIKRKDIRAGVVDESDTDQEGMDDVYE